MLKDDMKVPHMPYGCSFSELLRRPVWVAQNLLVPLGIFICRNECYENWKPKIIGQGFSSGILFQVYRFFLTVRILIFISLAIFVLKELLIDFIANICIGLVGL